MWMWCLSCTAADAAATATCDVRRWWLQGGRASQLSTDVASHFGLWHQSAAAVSDASLIFSLLPPACQNLNVICSPIFLLQLFNDPWCLLTVWCLCDIVLFLDPVPMPYVLTHISVVVVCLPCSRAASGDLLAGKASSLHIDRQSKSSYILQRWIPIRVWNGYISSPKASSVLWWILPSVREICKQNV